MRFCALFRPATSPPRRSQPTPALRPCGSAARVSCCGVPLLAAGWLHDDSFATVLALYRLPVALAHTVGILAGYAMLRSCPRWWPRWRRCYGLPIPL